MIRAERRVGQKNEIIFKVILIGESGTGKSCLMTRYVKGDFNPSYQPTIGTSPLMQARSFRVRLSR
jgi:GTPase SAR1 family protein